MGRKIGIIFKRIRWDILFVYLVLLFVRAPNTQSEQLEPARDSLIRLISPEEGCVNVAKKPRVKCEIGIPFDSNKLLVLFDGTDISGVLDFTPEGFEYKAHTLLPAGEHTLSITVNTQEGQEIKKEFKFSTCHSKVVDEIYSGNEITTVFEKRAVKIGNTITNPSWKFESNLANESAIKENKWEFNFTTNLRYLNQHIPITSPPGRRLSLANYLYQAKYGGEKLSFLAETGDVNIDEILYTVTGLARRGGNMVLQLKGLNLQLRTFDVKSEQLFGFKGGLGFGTTPSNHIMGTSLDWGMISDKLRFKTSM